MVVFRFQQSCFLECAYRKPFISDQSFCSPTTSCVPSYHFCDFTSGPSHPSLIIMSTITMTPVLHHLLHHLCRAQHHLTTMWNLIPAEIRTYYDTLATPSPGEPTLPDPDHNRALGNYIFTLSQPMELPPTPPPTTPPPTTSTPHNRCPAADFFDAHEALETTAFTTEVVQLFESPPPTLMEAKPKAPTLFQEGRGQLRFTTTPLFGEPAPPLDDPPDEAVSAALTRDWKLQDDQLLVQLKQDKRSRPSWTAVAKRLGRDVDERKDRWTILKQHNLEALQEAIPPELLTDELEPFEANASSASFTAETAPPLKRARHE